MIRSITLESFKCFVEETVRLAPLTILAGANGSGKSSLIQALLITHQAASQVEPGHILLNGPNGLELGSAGDVVNVGGSDVFSIRFDTDDQTNPAWDFLWSNPEARALEYLTTFKSDSRSAGLLRSLSYLSAERDGPRDVSMLDSLPTPRLQVGHRGQFTAHVLSERDRENVSDTMLHPKTPKVDTPEGALPIRTVGKQSELWMQEMVPGIEFRAEKFPGTGMVALRIRKATGSTDFLRPTNMAFGMSSALPVVVAGLIARPGSLLIVDSPESHLHPSAQSAIGLFLATAAASGVQVIIETHSDHVLNGVRLAVADAGILKNTSVVIQFFHGLPTSSSCADPIDVLPSGALSRWPSGFFDQTEKDLARIARNRGRRG